MYYNELWESWEFDYEKQSNYEWMTDPAVLKAFINFCVNNYPAENYDLILWDHGSGPYGGFGSDENDPTGGSRSMSFAELTDALYDNEVVQNGNGGKFDFVDFDACLMNSVEFNLVFSGCTKYYIASPETEPGYGQDYKGWLNALGEEPDMNTFDLGKRIVDDFVAFYDKPEGDGSSQEGTLAVIDMEKLMKSQFLNCLRTLNSWMDNGTIANYYDELRSASATLDYGKMSYLDLGILLSQLAYVYKEADLPNVGYYGELIDLNNYTDIAKVILNILNDKEIIYARGTEGIHTGEQFYRDVNGEMQYGTQGTSGMYLFFPNSDYINEASGYFDRINEIVEKMPEKNSAAAFLAGYSKTVLKYALLLETGRAVSEMTERGMAKSAITYDSLKEYWSKDARSYDYWAWHILSIMNKLGGEEAVTNWLELNLDQMAEEVILRDNITAAAMRDGAYTVTITDSRKQTVDSVDVNLIAELPALQAYLDLPENADYKLMYGDKIPGIRIGSTKGNPICDVDPQRDGNIALIKWLNDTTSQWKLPAIEEKWYALQDAEGTLHVTAAEVEDDGIYVCTGYPEVVTRMGEDGPYLEYEWHNVYLRFVDGKLLEVYFRQDSGGYRSIMASDLEGEMEVTPVIPITLFFSEDYYPISENSFILSADTAKDISLVYTDVKNISDICDTTGDGKALTTQVTLRNIYGYELDITDLVAEADNNVKPAPRPGGGGGGVTTPSNPVSLPDPASAPSGGKVSASAASAKAGDKVTLTLTPDNGYQVTGVTVTDKNGKDVPVTKNDDGTYSFTMPAAAVTVTPAFEKISESAAAPGSTDKADVSKTFTDVNGNAWYHDAVQWAVDKGLMNGVGNNTFQPNGTATRAMVVTMLWRLAGEPEAGASGFTDVADAAWYAGAVAWAEETGAVKGISETEFAPNETVTREQLAAILYRFAQAQGKGFTGAWSFPLSFPDAAEVSEYAYEPMCWMTMNGVINGMDDGTLAPGDNATRAQIAAMFMRFCAELEK